MPPKRDTHSTSNIDICTSEGFCELTAMLVRHHGRRFVSANDLSEIVRRIGELEAFYVGLPMPK
jgi:CRISPR/Cas system-associated protein Csm6